MIPQSWWLSTEKLTVAVLVGTNGKVVYTAPITRKFIGQDFEKLRNWMKKQPGYKEYRYA